jgi:sec-independent protein translocase protein TatB
MFEFDAGKLIIIAVAALIFIGPKDLPRVMRQVGQAVGKLRRMGAEFQAQFMAAMNEAGAEDLKADVSKLTRSAEIDFDPLHAANSEIAGVMRQIEAPVKAAAVEVASRPVAAVPASETAEIASVAAPPPVARAANE